MSLEPGGRADKYGNNYENHYLAKLLVRLVKEELTSVTVEPLGTYSNSVEFISEQKDGTMKYYQCKASNTTHSSWSIPDLKKHKVFSRAKEIIDHDIKNFYYFISPLQYGELGELCKRARTNSSPKDFVDFQLTNNIIKRAFDECILEFNLDKDKPSDVSKTIFLLSHCFFEQYITGTEAEQDFEEYISILFTGKPSIVRVLLEQYANDTQRYGVKITAQEIIDYLKKNDIYIRNYHNDETVLSRIQILNDMHWDFYYAIHENLVHRTATDNIIQNIKDGYSVILCGKAGAGKSGCLEETILYLKQTGILYLSIKLDKYVPDTSADTYGRKLGLPKSPIHCLATLAAGKSCVLILDQLDALRWTNNHSSDALDVCKELMQQAAAINKYSGGKISIVFASRTFDLDNDRGLKQLFASSSHSSASLKWIKINVDKFTKDDVIQVIGEVYNRFSSRLQKLLLTPSSLYVWSKLEKNAQNNSVSSVFELMNAWWEQILKKCTLVNLRPDSITLCKDKIVTAMEKRTTLSLPQTLFLDNTNEIDYLVSSGILNSNPNTKKISFTHQSFLDFFMTSNILNKIYYGEELKDLIGDMNHQTPFIRYHLLTVLQNLLDNDINLFIKQSIGLLEVSSVRFYFKCAIFEIIGQCDTPTDKIYKIIDEYIQKPEWSDYINQVVLYGHPEFVMRNFSRLNNDFPSDYILTLLKSINSKEPDFVTDKLSPFALKNPEQDSKIFWTLCDNINDDSNDMFKLRIKLLQNNPILFQNFWGFDELINQLSIRAIDLFEIIIEHWEDHKVSHLYIGEPANISRYVKQHAWPIVSKLFPKICEATHNYLPHWPNDRWNHHYEDWTANNFQESIVRKIIDIVKYAFAECAQSFPNKLILFVKEVIYPVSAVGHECIMHAVLNLPTDYANKAIEWFLEEIDLKVFVFSSNKNDFLSESGRILKKFSPTCSIALFQQLEQYICNWRESNERMLYNFNGRLEMQKLSCMPVYYAYWGHFQKALLPNMDITRLSTYSKQLLNVINRNSWIQLPYFYRGYIMGPTRTIVSPVDNYTERLSNKTWLQIISTPYDKMNDMCHGSDTSFYYVEANHRAFASALGNQAKREPLRFAKLSLSFPPGCYEGYISHVLYAFTDNNSNSEFDVELLSNVIRHYGHNRNRDIAIAIAHVIEKHANEIWPDDVINILVEIALNHPNPSEDEYSITSSSDPEHKSVESLRGNSINCARGCALYAIAALLWKHHDLGERFKSAILLASQDSNHAVYFAVMNCVLPYYKIERDFSLKIFTLLTEHDLRIIAAREYWEILSREYNNHNSYYRDILIKACLSEINDLNEYAAGLLCAVGIYHNDDDALSFIMSDRLGAEQERKICLQAIHSFNSDEYHEKSRIVLMYLIDHSSNKLQELNRLFFDRCINIQRDEEFLIHLMESRQNVYLFHSFLHYLYESDEDICNFACVLNSISNSFSKTPLQNGERFIVNDLVKCVIRLFDKGKDDLRISKICLDIWDRLFMNNLHSIKPLSDMIDDFE